MGDAVSYFPSGFDPRQDVVGVMDLVLMDTPDGPFRFILAADGKFTDTAGNVWWGSQLFGRPRIEQPINGRAPAIVFTISYFFDPDLGDDLAEKVMELGSDYVKGRNLKMFKQFLFSHNDLYQPVLAPIPRATFEMRHISTRLTGPVERAIALTCETSSAGRNLRRGLIANTLGHAALVGHPNPSLSFMPSDLTVEQKIWG